MTDIRVELRGVPGTPAQVRARMGEVSDALMRLGFRFEAAFTGVPSAIVMTDHEDPQEVPDGA